MSAEPDKWLQDMKDAPAPRVDPNVWASLDADRAEAQSLLEQATQLEESGDRVEAAQKRERATALLVANEKSRDYYLKIKNGWTEREDGRLKPPSAGAGESGSPFKSQPSMTQLVREEYDRRRAGGI